MRIVEDFYFFMQQGTWWIMWPLFGIGVVIWSLGFDRIVSLARFTKARRAFLASVNQISSKMGEGSILSGAYQQLLSAMASNNRLTKERFSSLYRQFLISTIPGLEQGFATISAWIYVSPLMGLLGTVIGMIETFKVIMLFGTNNPGLMAKGISIALLTTQAGLIVAFPALMLQVILLNYKTKIVNELYKDGEKIVTELN